MACHVRQLECWYLRLAAERQSPKSENTNATKNHYSHRHADRRPSLRWRFRIHRLIGVNNSAAEPALPSMPIVAGVVAHYDVPIYLTGVGTVIACNTDVTRSQIHGQIVSINFTEGLAAHTGDLLSLS
jgi:hypothetical protein